MRVFDSLSLPALILKPNRIIVSANENFLKKYDIDRNEILGRTCHDFFYQSKDACPFENCPLPEVLAKNKGHSILRKVITRTGEEKWEDRVFSPILDDQGVVRYIIESIRDVTQVKALEKELSGIREFTSKLIQSSTSGIVAADRNGNILIMNKAAEELTGHSIRERSLPLTVNDLYPDGMAAEMMRRLRSEDFGGVGKLLSTRTNLVTAAGEEIPIELTAAIIYEGSEEVATMGVFHDLRPKLADEQRMTHMLARVAHAEKMASLGQLAAGVAHEINNPLAVINEKAGLIKDIFQLTDRYAGDEKLLGLVEAINESVTRCGRITKQLLSFARHMDSSVEPVDLKTVISDVVGFLGKEAEYRNITIMIDVPPDLPQFESDRGKLQQILLNLINNAFAAQMDGGSLSISVTRVGDASLRIRVKDTGCGIPDKDLKRIFEPFFSTKTNTGGTGLGLSITYSLIQELGGSIDVSSEVGVGTEFIITLPLTFPARKKGRTYETASGR